MRVGVWVHVFGCVCVFSIHTLTDVILNLLDLFDGLLDRPQVIEFPFFSEKRLDILLQLLDFVRNLTETKSTHRRHFKLYE